MKNFPTRRVVITHNDSFRESTFPYLTFALLLFSARLASIKELSSGARSSRSVVLISCSKEPPPSCLVRVGGNVRMRPIAWILSAMKWKLSCLGSRGYIPRGRAPSNYGNEIKNVQKPGCLPRESTVRIFESRRGLAPSGRLKQTG